MYTHHTSVGLKSIVFIIDLTPEEECDGNAFGSVCLSVCLSVYTGQARNSKTIAPIY